MIELLPCPFCGCEIMIRMEHEQAFRLMPVRHHLEDCYIERFAIRQPDFLTEKKAINCWNTRILK